MQKGGKFAKRAVNTVYGGKWKIIISVARGGGGGG
jgi:hypothetical protein